VSEAQTQAVTETPAAPAPSGNDRASLLSELESLPSEPEPAEKPAAESDASSDEPAEAAEAAEPAKTDEEEDADTDADDLDEPTKPPEKDPATAKGLEAIQRREKQAKEAMARARAEFETEREQFRREWAPKLEALERFQKLSQRARYDVAGVLQELGVPKTDFEAAAKELYYATTAAEADPKYREAALRSAREREHVDALTQTRQELAELRSMIADRDRQQTIAAAVSEFIESTAKAVTDDTPIVSRWMAKNPAAVRTKLAHVAEQMIGENDGEVPDHADVVARLEKIRRAELEELEIDVEQYIKTPAAPKKTNPVAGEKRAAKTLGNDLGTQRTPRPKLTPQEERADLVRALEEGRLET
jgi:hypothetical protein